jgi:hypothetical protein
MIEFILELIPPRLFGFLIGVLFIIGGVYVWQAGSAERALYDNATGAGCKTSNAEIRYKTTRQEASAGVNDDAGIVDVDYFDLSYEEDGLYRSVSVAVDKDEFESHNPGDQIKISFHPGLPDYIVTPMKERPGVMWYRIGGVLLILLGALFVLMILVSLFGD